MNVIILPVNILTILSMIKCKNTEEINPNSLRLMLEADITLSQPDAALSAIDKLEHILSKIRRVQRGQRIGAKHGRTNRSTAARHARYTSGSGLTTDHVTYVKQHGYFTNFMMEIMHHFTVEDYDEAGSYAYVFRQVVNDRYINESALHMLGDPFLKLMRGLSNYLVTVPAAYVRERIAYVRSFMEHRSKTFTPDFNSLLDYMDSWYNRTDRTRMVRILERLRDPRAYRRDVVREFVDHIVTEPFLRLQKYHRLRFAEKLSAIIRSSKFHGAFDRRSLGEAGEVDFEDYGGERELKDEEEWRRLARAVEAFVEALAGKDGKVD